MNQKITRALCYFMMRVVAINLVLMVVPGLQKLQADPVKRQTIETTFIGIEAKNVMDSLLVRCNIDYIQKSRNVIIFYIRDKKYFNDRETSFTISGKITDAKENLPMAGVSVVVKGTVKGTTSDVNGDYIIEADNDDVLIFSSIGYEAQEHKVGNSTEINVALSEDVESLREIEVYAGYYHVKKSEYTGNISGIDAETIEKQPITNPIQSIQGRVTGAYIKQSTGLPGGSFSIRIRGQNSLRSNGNDPLYLIDGVPFTSSSLHSNTVSAASGQTNPLNSINPSDIESIEILKDADATAIYGSRGGNGVVLITTKKGKSGRSKVNFNISRGVGTISKKMDLLNTNQYLEMRHEAFRNDEASPKSTDYDLTAWDSTRYTDWQEYLIGGTSNIFNSQISVSAGTDNIQYLVSGGYFSEGTVFPGNSSYVRGSGHVSINSTSDNRKFKNSVVISYTSDKNNLPQTDLTSLAVSLSPIAPKLFDENGHLNWERSTWTNPLSQLYREYNSTTENLIANNNLSYELIKNLLVKARIGYTNLRMGENSINPIKALDPSKGITTGTSIFGNQSIKTYIVEPQVEYDFKFLKGRVRALIGSTFQQDIRQNNSIVATGYTSDALLRNINAASAISKLDAGYTKYRYNALFGRLNYAFEDRYFVNITARRDGSSRFGSDRRFANFGAVGVAWNFSNEDFVSENIGILSFGKLRASYGTTGSDQIPDYGFLDQYGPTHSYQNQATLIPSSLANPDFSWEVNKKMEAGISLGFLDDRISFDLSMYRNRSSNQLIGYSLPVITGFSTVQYNFPATIQNIGIEIELNTSNIKTDNIFWTSSFNLSIPRNKLVEFPDIKKSAYANSYFIGEPIFRQNLLHYIGVDSETGIHNFEDYDGNGSNIDYPADYRPLKQVSQSYYGGFQNTLNLNRVQIDIFVQFVKQTGLSYIRSFTNAPGAAFNQPALVMDRWRVPGDVSDVQRFTQNSGPARTQYTNANFNSDKSITDASFIRIKNISLSYYFPNKILEKIKIQEASMSLNVQNVLTITNYVGLDPENQLSRVLPPLRVFSMGINVTF